MAKTDAKLIAAIGTAVILVGTAILICCSIKWPLRQIPPDWSVISGDRDQWSFTRGAIAGHSTTGDSILASAKEYRNITLSAVVGTTNREATLAFRMQDAKNGYLVVFIPNPWGRLALVRRESGVETELVSYHERLLGQTGKSAKITVTADGPAIEVGLNGARVIHVRDTTFAQGLIGFRIFGEGSWPCDATFSRVTF